jgi:hypothetical protein
MDKPIPEEVILKQICKAKKLDPRLSRMLLREAVKDAKKYLNLSKDRTARAPWVWAKGSKGLEEALTALNSTQPQKSPTEKVTK